MAMTVQSTFSTGPAAGYAGMLDSNVDHDILTMVNAEASARMVFGRAVVFKGTVTTDKDAVLPASQSDVPVGILVHSHNYARVWTDEAGVEHGELKSDGLVPGAHLNILRRGRILVVCEDGCKPGDKLYIRAVAAGDPEFLGGLNNAADATDMIDATTKGTWLTTAAAGGLAWLDVNF